jgi:hypothetical protein
LRLLEDTVVELNIVDRASDNTIERTLKEAIWNQMQKSSMSFRPLPSRGQAQSSAAFVANMEGVLDVYHLPRDSGCPVVCLDETSKQLVAETCVPMPAKPGRPMQHDYKYERNRLPQRRLGHGEPVHAVRASGGLAARRGDRSLHRGGLRTPAQRSVQHVDYERAEDRLRPG